MVFFPSALVFIALAARARAATYSLSDSHTGTGFLKSFDVMNIADPTHGRVNYVDADTAARLNLTYASGDHFILRADDTTKLSASGPGRNSVRIQSHKQYTTSVMVFNILHMPRGCGTWPAVWTVGGDWPNQGEIDILEGVNDKGPNQSTLHTNSGCSMPSSRSETGSATGNNCDSAATNNAGCGVISNSDYSYGESFNGIGGGWYALERTNSAIKIWFWPRNAGNVPSDVSSGASSVNTGNWGTPTANFPSTSCNIGQHFGPHNIIINLTFCGDWAGSSGAYAGCPSTCVDYVNNNPSAFNLAYFDFTWLKIYE